MSTNAVTKSLNNDSRENMSKPIVHKFNYVSWHNVCIDKDQHDEIGVPGTSSVQIKSELKLSNAFLFVEYDPDGVLVRVCPDVNGDTTSLEFLVKSDVEFSRMGNSSLIFRLEFQTVMLTFMDGLESGECSAKRFFNLIDTVRNESKEKISVFTERTEESSATQYFQFYGYLSQQQNMMQDYTRTFTYQKAIINNISDFKDKVVLDVGAGSAILSFFAVQAGAKKVYAVEGSSIAKHAAQLVSANGMSDIIEVISGKIEEIDVIDLASVDTIISEPMGYMLVNERMLETFIHARKWLKPGGRMFPSRGDLHVAPFCDPALYMEHISKVNFWYQDSFHGVSLTALRQSAMAEYFKQPIVDTFDVRICLAKTQQHVIDFETAKESDLHKITIPLQFHIIESGTVHGLAFWFDVAFIGAENTVWLSTAPTEPLTHWYQVRCLIPNPIMMSKGEVLGGTVQLVANAKQSYDVQIDLHVEGDSSSQLTSSNTLDLKNPFFRYTGMQPAPPPGQNSVSPSEAYWSQVDMQGAKQAVNLVNGMIVDGLGHVSLDSSAVTSPPHPVALPTALATGGNLAMGQGAGAIQQTVTVHPSVGDGIVASSVVPSLALNSASSIKLQQNGQGVVVPSQQHSSLFTIPPSNGSASSSHHQYILNGHNSTGGVQVVNSSDGLILNVADGSSVIQPHSALPSSVTHHGRVGEASSSSTLFSVASPLDFATAVSLGGVGGVSH